MSVVPTSHVAKISQGGRDIQTMGVFLKFLAPLCEQHGFSIEVGLLPQVTKAHASPKLLFKLVNPSWMSVWKHSKLGYFGTVQLIAGNLCIVKLIQCNEI